MYHKTGPWLLARAALSRGSVSCTCTNLGYSHLHQSNLIFFPSKKILSPKGSIFTGGKKMDDCLSGWQKRKFRGSLICKFWPHRTSAVKEHFNAFNVNTRSCWSKKMCVARRRQNRRTSSPKKRRVVRHRRQRKTSVRQPACGREVDRRSRSLKMMK